MCQSSFLWQINNKIKQFVLMIRRYLDFLTTIRSSDTMATRKAGEPNCDMKTPPSSLQVAYREICN